MSEHICQSCYQICETIMESGNFDADGPGGTRTYNMGDYEISECCQEATETMDNIDLDYYAWWSVLNQIAGTFNQEIKVKICQQDFEHFLPQFNLGLSPKEALITIYLLGAE